MDLFRYSWMLIDRRFANCHTSSRRPTQKSLAGSDLSWGKTVPATHGRKRPMPRACCHGGAPRQRPRYFECATGSILLAARMMLVTAVAVASRWILVWAGEHGCPWDM